MLMICMKVIIYNFFKSCRPFSKVTYISISRSKDKNMEQDNEQAKP